jgi:putative DNA primase/helicase
MTTARENVQELLPGAKIIKLKGYYKNKDYKSAKTPIEAWQQADDLQDEEIGAWLDLGGWIGATIPTDRLIIDIDDQETGGIVDNILEEYGFFYHAIKTPNGRQFIFKESPGEEIRQIAKYFTSIGVQVDTRIAGKGYIVFPTDQTENRTITKKADGDLSDLPRFLIPIKRAAKHDFSFPITDQGNRNDTLYRFAASLRSWGLEPGEIDSSMKMIYDFLLLDKRDFSFSELQNLIKSAIKWEPDIVQPYEISVADRRLPMSYQAKQNQLFKTVIKKARGVEFEELKWISRSTPHILKELRDLESGQVFYEIAWMEHGEENRKTLEATNLTTKRELLRLANFGLGVNENNAKDMIEYFEKSLAQIRIPRVYKAERLGWIKNRFIHPLDSGEVLLEPSSSGERQIVEAFREKGTIESWRRDVFDQIKDHPKVLFMVFASFASIILKDLEIKSFVVDLSGSTSQGKTTALQVSRTVWGNEGLINEWNVTRVSVERKAAFFNDFPLYMDDTRKADERILQSIVYQFSGGKAKGRGSLTGQQDETTWNNILISTGEISLADFAEKAGGAVARIIPLVDEPFNFPDQEFFSKIYKAIAANHGTPGLKFLKAWQQNKKKWIPLFETVRNSYRKRAEGDEVIARMSLFYSTVHFAAAIAKEVLELDFDMSVLSDLFDEIMDETDGTNKPRELMEVILADLDRSRKSILYEDSEEIPKEIKAIYYQGTVCLMAAYAKDMLGTDNRMIRREWKKKNYILTTDEKRDTIQIFKKGNNYRAIMINPSILNDLGYDFSDQHAEPQGNIFRFPFKKGDFK